MGVFAVLYGLVRASLLFVVVALFFGLSLPGRELPRRARGAAVASVSFIGIGMMTAVLPLISPEKGAQLGFVAQGMLLVVSGVYYPVGAARVDAVALDDLAGDLCAARHPRLDPRRRGLALGPTSGRCS